MPNIILNNKRLIIFVTTLGSIFGHISKLVRGKEKKIEAYFKVCLFNAMELLR